MLHDGAPNVGADWRQDAYDQNVLTLQSLKLACDFLREGGMFITKIFRSKDYNALLWVFNKLFEKVDATKPHSSRGASAEIFVVCRRYIAPSKIDQRMLDPVHVFKDDIPTTNKEAGLSEDSKMSIGTLNKQLVGKKPRQRQGYDDSEALLVKKNMSVPDFIESNDPVRLVSEATSLLFDSRAKDAGYLESPHTTEDIKAFCSDLKVLGRKDFKELLKWRLQLRKDNRKALADSLKEDQEDVEMDQESSKLSGQDNEEKDEDEETEQIENELQEEYQKRKRESKREAKRKWKDARRSALGLNKYSVDMEAYDMDGGDPAVGYTQFSLLNKEDTGKLAVAMDDDEDQKSIGEISIDSDSQGSGEEGKEGNDDDSAEDEDEDDKEAYLAALEDQLDYQYNQYLAMKNNKEAHKGQEESLHAVGGKKLSRRQRMEAEAKTQLKQKEDKLDYVHQQYLKMLSSSGKSKKDGDESDSESSDDDDDDDDEDSDGESNDSDDNENTMGVSRWFSQNLFDEVNAEESVEPAKAQVQPLNGASGKKRKRENDAESQEESQNEDASNEVLNMLEAIPKSEREKRKERLRKQREKQQHKSKKVEEKGFEVVPQGDIGNDQEEGDDAAVSAKQSQKSEGKRKLIEAGMGKAAKANKKSENGGMEIVPAENNEKDDEPDPRDQQYDSDTHAEILALGKLMKKHTKAKELVDASYNRYAFDDPALPSWFAADEAAHFRPQLPVDKSEVDKIKQRFRDISARPIHKVAEARARKKRKLTEKMNKARRYIANIASDNDISQVSKAKAAEKAMRKVKLKKPETSYAVTGKDGRAHGKAAPKGANVKKVDRRMLADKRGENKKKGGKRGGKTKGRRGKKR